MRSLVSIRPSAKELKEHKPRRIPVVQLIRIAIYASDELFQKLQEELPPNGRTGSKSFNKHYAVLALREYDEANSRALVSIDDAVLWKALKTVFTEIGVMQFGLLTGPTSEEKTH